MALRLLSTRISSLRSRPPPPAVTASLQKRGFWAAASENEELTITVPVPFKTHNVDPPSQDVETSKSELLGFFTDMSKMRRMEAVAVDRLYKSRFIRGFCHLYAGQEAVCVGMEAALTFDDAIITAYRDHCTHLGRGGTILEVIAELMGHKDGCSKGKGGSMHMYNKAHNFYGGNGIVGAQVPLGVGVAFGQQYNKLPNVTVAMYGDGAANQGQLFEALNIAALWKLPCVLVCENNHYGMGTAEWRSSKSHTYYKRGDYVPGILVDGMNALAVKQAIKFAKEYALENGPLLVEMDTYRYHGHSVSDPDNTYREREATAKIRKERDPINEISKLILTHELATEADLKAIERDVKKEVDDAVEKAKKSPQPETELLYAHIHSEAPNNFKVYGADRRHSTVKLD